MGCDDKVNRSNFKTFTMLNMVLLCRETPILHRGVTYQTEEKEVAETMKHYGGAKLLNGQCNT